MGDQVELESTTRFIRYASNDRLNRHLESLQELLYDEVRRGVDCVFGSQSQDQDDHWKEINLYGSMQDVVFPVMCRVFLGKELGESDEERQRVLTVFQRYLMAMGISTIFIGELPRVLKGVVARLVRIPLAYYRSQTLRMLVPLVRSQLSSRTKEGQDDDEKGSDFIKHCAKLSTKSTLSGTSGEAGPDLIAEWIMMLASSLLIKKAEQRLKLTKVFPGICRFLIYDYPSNQSDP